MHHEIAVRTAHLALSSDSNPRRVLHVGCGTGLLLRTLAERLPQVEELVGIDAAEGMIAVAGTLADDARVVLSRAVAEDLPYPDSSFDLVVSTTSFHHWKDQEAGLRECARVLTPTGHFVLADLFSVCLIPTMIVHHGDRGWTKHRAETLLRAAGFRRFNWNILFSLIIGAVVASK